MEKQWQFFSWKPNENDENKKADENDENKKAKDTKKCLLERKLKFEDYKPCLEATQLENKINQLEKNNDRSQNFLILQPILNTFAMPASFTKTVKPWESKGLSSENI